MQQGILIEAAKAHREDWDDRSWIDLSSFIASNLPYVVGFTYADKEQRAIHNTIAENCFFRLVTSSICIDISEASNSKLAIEILAKALVGVISGVEEGNIHVMIYGDEAYPPASE